MLNIIASTAAWSIAIFRQRQELNKPMDKLSLSTNYLILGLAPNEKGDPAQLSAYSKIMTKRNNSARRR